MEKKTIQLQGFSRFAGKLFLFAAIAQLALSSVWMPSTVFAAETVKVLKSFNVGEVSGIAVDANGIVWFTQRVALKLGRLDPGTGAVKLYPIPYQTGARYGGGGNPEAILVASSGDIWFSEIPMMDGGGQARIARFHPDTERFDEYLINPSWWNGYGGSISIGPTGLSEGPDGRIWFNDRAANPPHIGYIVPATGNVTIFTAFPGNVSSGSLDIAVTADGSVWYANGLFSGDNGLYRFDEATGTFTNMHVGRAFDLAALATEPSGNLWFTTFTKNIGMVTPDGVVHTYTSNLEVSSLYLGLDKKGKVWFSDYSNLYRLDPQTGVFSRYYLGLNVMLIHVDRQDRLWVGSWNTIALVSANLPLIADAGPDQTIECAGRNGTAVRLNGSGSSNPNGDPLTYTWAWSGGSAGGVSPFVTLPLGKNTITLTVDDGKGGTGTDTVIVTVRDSVPPVSTVRGIAGIAGNNGWYQSDVTLIVDAVDACSGVKEIRYNVDGEAAIVPGNTATIAVNGDGLHTVTFGAADNAGNVEQAKMKTVSIDKTVPVITASVSPSPNGNDWYNSDVTVTFSCGDALSGVASCPAPVTVTAEGAGQAVTGTAVDKAGNAASTSVTVNIDKTAPAANISLTPAILWPPNRKPVNVAVNGGATDNLSGVASVVITVADEYGTIQPAVNGFNTSIPLEAWREGADMDGRHYLVTAAITDRAGNKTTVTTEAVCPHDMRDKQ